MTDDVFGSGKNLHRAPTGCRRTGLSAFGDHHQCRGDRVGTLPGIASSGMPGTPCTGLSRRRRRHQPVSRYGVGVQTSLATVPDSTSALAGRDPLPYTSKTPSRRLISRVLLSPLGRLPFAETRLIPRHRFGDYTIAAVYADGAIGFVREEAPQTERPRRAGRAPPGVSATGLRRAAALARWRQ